MNRNSTPMRSAQTDELSIRLMTIADYDDVFGLLSQTEGVTFRDADSRDSTRHYLERNPGLSFVALQGDRMVGCVMCGHDGRRGYLQHLCVAPGSRRQGVASLLIERCLAGLERLGIVKTHIDVLATNEAGQRFWANRGWGRREDIIRYSLVRKGSDNA